MNLPDPSTRKLCRGRTLSDASVWRKTQHGRQASNAAYAPGTFDENAMDIAAGNVGKTAAEYHAVPFFCHGPFAGDGQGSLQPAGMIFCNGGTPAA